MSVDLTDIQDSFLEPQKWWNLHTDGKTIRVASFWQWVYQWFEACLTESLKTRLCENVQTVLQNARPYAELNESQKIVVDKVSSLIRNKTTWFSSIKGNFPALPQPSPILRTQGQIPSDIKPHVEGGRYYNYPGEKIWTQFFETLRLLFPGALRSPADVNLATWNRVLWDPCSRSIEPKVTWLGHSALLLQINGFNLLLDPSFNFVGPCFRRHTPPGIAFDALPNIDVVITSHNHGDHFDQGHLQRLAPHQPIAFVPAGLDTWFTKHGYQTVEGKEWWQQTTLTRDGKSIKITAIPAQHGSQTTLSDLNATLWMGVVIEVDGFKIYFAGDTGYREDIFKEIRAKFGEVDVAFLPIAPENEREMHTDHRDALQAMRDLSAKKMVPIHWGAYRTGVEQIPEPLKKLQEALDSEFSDLKNRVVCPQLGQTLALVPAVANSAVA